MKYKATTTRKGHTLHRFELPACARLHASANLDDECVEIYAGATPDLLTITCSPLAARALAHRLLDLSNQILEGYPS